MPSQFLRYPIRGEKFSYSLAINEHLVSRRTEYQQIDIWDTECFGRILTLDGHVQLATVDEFAYHEALVHIPMLSISDARRALVVGGGDGGVLRELCKWSTLERIDLVEIDSGVIEACRRYLPEVTGTAFDDPRVSIHIRDAFGFLEGVADPYDLILMDITDTYEGEGDALSEALFTDQFHSDAKNALSEQGFLISQSDNNVFCPYSMEQLLATLSNLFPASGSYQAIVPSFGGFSGFCWASKGQEVAKSWPGDHGLALRYLNETTYALAMQPFGFDPSKLSPTLKERTASVAKENKQ